MSDRTRELAERQAELQLLCEAQRVLIASEVAAIEKRFESVDRAAGVIRSVLLNPVVVAGGVVVLLAIARARGLRFLGRAVLLVVAVRRLLLAVSKH